MSNSDSLLPAVDVSANEEPTQVSLIQDPGEVDAAQWDALLATQDKPTPFFSHAYLRAMFDSQSATPETGWQVVFVLLRSGAKLLAATALYIKSHSYGEYVFDWAWANAYQQHGLNYYPKALVASPFTPVPASRLLAVDDAARSSLVGALIGFCETQKLSSLHVNFLTDADQRACASHAMMMRSNVQFHWQNTKTGYRDFDAFLDTLAQDKRKKIKAEQRKVAQAGVTWRVSAGAAISNADWQLFYRCYQQTYAEHGNPPYLTPAFFEAMASTQAHAWVMFVAEKNGNPIATSLIAVDSMNPRTKGQKELKKPAKRAFGRYWGALDRVDSLHFDACYYQPLRWCIEQGFATFEGGAQGEHKMARGLMPVQAFSAHWLAHPGFADAVDRFLDREGDTMTRYVSELEQKRVFRTPSTEASDR